MNKISRGFLIIAALSSILFLFIVEYYNNLTLDDLGFASQLQKESIWKFIVEIYFTWQGRFMGFLITGVQMKSFFLFNSMVPFSLVLYIINISLVSKSLINFFNLKKIESVLVAIIFFQLYVYSMFDISSYFWMCTKGYTFMVLLSLFAFSELSVNKSTGWNDYVILFVTFAFLGCSYEIFAPVVLLIIWSVLFYKLNFNGYNIKKLLSDNKRIVFSAAIGTLFFSLMIIAPGNRVRMSVQPDHSNLILSDYLIISGRNGFHLIKLLLFKFPYFIAAGCFLWSLFPKIISATRPTSGRGETMKWILVYASFCLVLCLVSVLLNIYAVGSRLPLRAFNHINLIWFIFIGYSLYEFTSSSVHKKLVSYALSLSLIFVILTNIFNAFESYPELKAYRESVNSRIAKLEMLRKNGNKETIVLEPLNVAEFHSIDDAWKLVVPKYSNQLLLKPNEVSNRIDMHYNKAYREFYKLDFDVITDLSFEL